MHGHVIWYFTFYRCMVMLCDTSPTIDSWSCNVIHLLRSCLLPSMHDHVIWYITYHRCIIMSYDTSPIIDAWLCHMIHHLPSMHDHDIWYITYHRCMIMLYVTSPTIDASSCHLILLSVNFLVCFHLVDLFCILLLFLTCLFHKAIFSTKESCISLLTGKVVFAKKFLLRKAIH